MKKITKEEKEEGLEICPICQQAKSICHGCENCGREEFRMMRVVSNEGNFN